LLYQDLTHVAQYNTVSGVATIIETKMAEELGIDLLFRGVARIEFFGNIPALMKSIAEAVGRQPLQTVPTSQFLTIKFSELVVSIYAYPTALKEIKRTGSVILYGEIDEVVRVHRILEEKHPRTKSNSVDWYHAVDGKPDKTTVELSHNYDMKDEYVPWIQPSVAEFQRQFLDSTANVLLMIGDPGCGKTSFVRDLINRNDLSAAVTYDEDLMKKDKFFIEFMNKPYDLLVVEDADIILRDREGGNKVMGKLLNASDGLVQTKKKIIFTANLTNLNEVDPALIRPGRCFETLIFRELTAREVTRAAAAAGIADPGESRTLSQLFQSGPQTKVRPTMGFAL
jgi:hypothetical protein